jgi:hypothetical protein
MTINPFHFHTGLEYTFHGTNQLRGTCIFCGKDDHFYFDQTDFLWSCKSCQRNGNLYSFLTQFHAQLLPDPVLILAEERGIPVKYFHDNRIRYNQFLSNGSYLVFAIPTYNKDGALNNLYKVIPNPKKPGKRLILCTPSLSSTLFNQSKTSHQEIWLLEGHWDKLAGEAITTPREITCRGWPGNGWKASWANDLAGLDVCIFPDHDAINPNSNTRAGEEELKQIIKSIEACSVKPKSIKVMKWPEGTPEGFDVNDVLRTQGPNAYTFLHGNLEPYEASSVKLLDHPIITGDETCDTFEKLLADAASTYYFTNDMELLLLAMITSLYSLKVDGEQMWLRIMGPPGSSKTTLAKIIGSSERTTMRDTFTGLLSGWKDEQAQDASMVPMIADRALIVKDADAMLQQPNVSQIMSELRAFYDKQIAVTYRNRVNYDYTNIRSTFIFCGTHTLRDMDNTSLGERFLDFELHVTDKDRSEISKRVLDNQIALAYSNTNPEVKIFERAKGFIDGHLLTRTLTGTVGDKERNAILQLGSLISYMRASVVRDYKGRIKYKPYPEVPSRITGQLTKVFQCVPAIFNSTHIPSITHRLIRHATRDIINVHSLRYRVCEVLHKEPFVSGEEVCRSLHPTPPEIIAREIENMVELGMMEIAQKRTSAQYIINTFGLKPHIYEQFGMILEPDE